MSRRILLFFADRYQFDIHPLDSSLWNDDEDEADGDEDEMDADEPPQSN